MSKILIVDDEILVRVGLRSAIDWYGNGFEIIGEAANGKEALKLLIEGKPDIMLMDIKMPIMDGIELLEIIKQRKITVRIIVLSCHDEYEYVREALKRGASDYLLKLSLNPQNLLGLLLELKKEIENSDAGTVENKEEKVEGNWQKLLYQFSESVWEEQLLCGIKLKDNRIIVFSLAIDSFAKLSEKGQFKDKSLLKSSVNAIINNIINDYTCGDSFAIAEGKYAVIINPRSDDPNVLKQILQNIQDSLKRYMQVTVSIGVSDIVECPKQLNSAYRQAYEALNGRFFTGCESILFHNKHKQILVNKTSVLFGLDMEQNFKRAIDMNHSHEAKEILLGFFSGIRKMEIGRIEDVYRAIDDLLYTFSKELKLYDKSFGDMTGFEEASPQNEIRKLDFLDELQEWLMDFTNKFFRFVAGLKESGQREDIRKAVDYIIANYAHKLSVGMVAEHVSMSVNYFSHLFKKEVGESFTDHLNNYRLDRAKEMLRSTDLRINEIAERVGFDNIYYFSNVFRKYIGVSPVEYKKGNNTRKEINRK